MIFKLQNDFIPNFKKVDVVFPLNLISVLPETVHIFLIVLCWFIVFISRTGKLTLQLPSILTKILKTNFLPIIAVTISNFFFFYF